MIGFNYTILLAIPFYLYGILYVWIFFVSFVILLIFYRNAATKQKKKTYILDAYQEIFKLAHVNFAQFFL